MDRLAAEHDNCAAALRSCIDTGDATRALRFVGALTWFWIMRDYDTEAGEWAVAVRQLTGDAPPPGLGDAYAICEFVAMIKQLEPEFMDTARLRETLRRVLPLAPDTRHPLLVLARPMVSVLSGDLESARSGLRAVAQHPDPWVRAAQHLFCGHLSIHEGHIDEASDDLSAAYAAFNELGDRWGMIVCQGGLAEVALARGAPAEAVRLLEEARGYAAEGLAGNWSEMMNIPLGRARAEAGDVDGARADLQTGVSAAERIGEHDDQASGYVALGEMARRDGDLARASSMLARALEIIEQQSRRPNMGGVTAITYGKLGCVAEQQGDLTAAAAWHAKALGVLRDGELALLPSNPTLGIIVEGIAALSAARGEQVRAAELLGLAHTLQGYRNATSLEVIRASTAISAALSEPARAAAYARGRQFGRRDALALEP
jgi:tetratricopeptide (TPR) repeat protein